MANEKIETTETPPKQEEEKKEELSTHLSMIILNYEALECIDYHVATDWEFATDENFKRILGKSEKDKDHLKMYVINLEDLDRTPEQIEQIEEVYGRCRIYTCDGTEEDKKDEDKWVASEWVSIGPYNRLTTKVSLTELNIKDTGKIEYVLRSKDMKWDKASFAIYDSFMPTLTSRYEIDLALGTQATIEEVNWPIRYKDEDGKEKIKIPVHILSGLTTPEPPKEEPKPDTTPRIKKVRYLPNGGTGDSVTEEIDINKEYTIKNDIFTAPSGKILKAYAQDEKGVENPREPLSKILFNNTHPLTWYAIWE